MATSRELLLARGIAHDWRAAAPDWPQTRYEAKASAKGDVRYYFRFSSVGPVHAKVIRQNALATALSYVA